VMSSKVGLTYQSEKKGVLDNKTYEREKEEETQMEWNFVGRIVFQWINWPRDLDLLG